MDAETGTELTNSTKLKGYADAMFKFDNVCFTVPSPEKGEAKKTILHNISGRVESGQVLAIMGPSGAGKTTLINVLTLNAFGGTASGTITLNAEPITRSSFFKDCFVVTQQDNHWPFLTCEETMTYAAELYLGTDAKGVKPTVDKLLEKMGLESCAKTKVGNMFMQGMSGGQKRRLSIALALIKQPKLLFLDEPTSGLDAAAAVNIMVFVKELAKAENLIVVATIHQPSSKVYAGFDQVMILSGGREAYCGDARETMAYFEGLGHPVSDLTNPAEFFLDLVNNDFMDQKEVDKVLDVWQEHKKKLVKETLPVSSERLSNGDRNTNGSIMHEIQVMLRRHALLVMRDPVLYIGRAVIFLFANLFFSLVYIKARNRTQDQVLNRMWLTIWYVGVPANMGVVAVYALNEEFKSVSKEIKNGMITPLSYMLAKTVLQIPIMFIFAIFALGQAYLLMDYYKPNFGLMILVWSCMIYSWEAMAEMLSVMFDNPLIGMMLFMGQWFNAFLFGGFLIPGEDMIWPLKIFYYPLPIKYTTRSMNYIDNIDAEYDACEEYDDAISAEAKEICFGEDGKDVLKAMGRIYPLITEKNTIAQDILILVAIAVGFKMQYVALLYMRSRAVSKLEPPISVSL